MRKWQSSIEVAGINEHPIPVGESVNMAAIPLPDLSIPIPDILKKIARSGYISDLQYETAAYAAQAMLSPPGAFFLGDATGVGKTRTALASVMILEDIANSVFSTSHSCKFRCLWISCQSKLEEDVKATLDAMKDESKIQWQTISTVLGETKKRKREDVEYSSTENCIAFATYSAIRKNSTATEGILTSVIKWLNSAEKAIIVMDEVHVAKNSNSSTSTAICRLQRQCDASVLFCTATAASDVKNLGYMVNLGLFGDHPDAPFDDHKHCVKLLKRNGTAALEMVALHLKSRGLYMSRSIIDADENSVVGPPITLSLSPDKISLYDDYCRQWIEAEEQIMREGNEHRLGLGLFTGLRQNFFLRLLLYFKSVDIIDTVEKYIKDGYSVVISLQSTGQSSSTVLNSEGGIQLPQVPSALDFIVTGLQQRGIPVCEITGRTHRNKYDPITQSCTKERRSSSDVKREMEDFQNDKLNVAVISSAGSTGISLHATSVDSPRRIHLLLELPWSSELLLQQCGRTNRAGQSKPPLYRVVEYDILLDHRVANVVKKRMKNLGALSRGDRDYHKSPTDNYVFSLPALRLASLEMMLRETTSLTPVGKISRSEARHNLHVGNGFHETSIINYGSQMLCSELTELHSDTPTRSKNSIILSIKKTAESIICLLPHVKWGTTVTWTPSTHTTFNFREKHLACRLKIYSKLGGNLLSILPDDLMEYVISLVLRDDWYGVDASEVMKSLQRARITRKDLISGPEGNFTSRICAVPVGIQQLVGKTIENCHDYIMSSSEIDEAPITYRGGNKISTLQNHCFPHGVPKGCISKFQRVPSTNLPAWCTPDLKQSIISIEASLEPETSSYAALNEMFDREINRYVQTAYHPTSNLYYSTASRSLRLVYFVNHSSKTVAWDIEVYSPGAVDPVARILSDNWEEWKSSNLIPVTGKKTMWISDAWKKEQDIHIVRRRRRCNKFSMVVNILDSKHAFSVWGNTTGQLVRAEPPQVPFSAVGLVV